MKSSVAVFTRDDPFPPPPIQKTWYHPSRRQNLTQKKSSKNASGPGCASQPDKSQSTAEQRQKRGLNRKPVHLQTPADDHLTFKESWPSTDLDSPPTDKTFSPNLMDTPGLSVSTGKFNVSSPHQEDSVLAKYVERFRYGEPRSRAERRPVSSDGKEEARPCWWMAPSSLPSRPGPGPPGRLADDAVPLKEDRVPGSPVERREELRIPRPYREPLDVSTLELSDCSLEDHWDPEGVQERASRLLHKSESSVSSGSLVISSEGLGGPELSPVSVHEPVPRPLSSRLMESTMYNQSSASPTGGPSQISDMVTSFGSRQRPEEDILFQWRLRRKMEQARHCPQPLSQPFPSLHQPPSALQGHVLHQPPSAWQSHVLTQPPSAWQSPSLHQPPLASQIHVLTQPPSASQSHGLPQPPSAWQGHVLPQPASAWQSPGLPQAAVSGGVDHQQQTTNLEPGPPQGTVPFALLGSQLGRTEVRGLDALSMSTPYPPPSQPASTQQAAMEPCLWDGSPGPAPSVPPTTQPNISTKHSQPNLRAVGERESCPPASSSDSRKEERSSETKHSENEQMADRKMKMKRSRRPAGDRPGPPAAGGSRPRPDRMVASTPQRLSQSKDEWTPPAPSPVHQALRQAVSEVLFPPRGSSSSSSVTRRRAPPALPGPPGPDASPRSPAEVVSQLLQEAEDSDGEQFEDDSLLRVLRTQRTWVKDQISQVDSLLEEFPPEGEVT